MEGIRLSSNGDAHEEDDTGDVVTRTFAVMLAELEDTATELTNRQAELSRELADVDAQLDRVEAVRSAMVGHRKPSAPRTPGGRRRSSGEGRKETASQRRVAKVLAWARHREANGQPEFMGADMAEMLEVNVQGVGPVLAGMVRRKELTVREDGHAKRFYSVAKEA